MSHPTDAKAIILDAAHRHKPKPEDSKINIYQPDGTIIQKAPEGEGDPRPKTHELGPDHSVKGKPRGAKRDHVR
ncbi:hypothetical protein HK104_004999, partial [Borealophlyctis nickersoniae]